VDDRPGGIKLTPLLAPLAALVLIGVVLLYFRHWLVAVLPLVTAGVGLLWTGGLLGLMEVPINLLGAMLPALALIIGSTEDIFIYSAYLEQREFRAQISRRKSVRRAMRRMVLPLLLTTLTTALGFSGGLFSDMGLVRDFSKAAVLAIVCNGVATVLIVPWALTYFGPRTTSRIENGGQRLRGLPGVIMEGFEFLIFRHPMAILATALIGVLLMGYQATRIEISNDPLSFFDRNTRLVIEMERFNADFYGDKSFFVRISSPHPGAFQRLDNLKKAEVIQSSLQQGGQFDSTWSIINLLHYGQQTLFGGPPRLPDEEEVLAQYLSGIPEGMLHGSVDLPTYRHMDILVRHSQHDSSMVNWWRKDLERRLQKMAGPNLKIELWGYDLLANQAAESLLMEQLYSMAALIGIIFVMMSVLFTSFKGGVISLIPNLVPLVFIYGTLALMGEHLNPASCILGVIIIGVATDDTIHLLMRFNEKRRRSPHHILAIRKTLLSEAIPVTTTSVALMGGFLVFLWSDFAMMAQFGWLAAMALMMAVIADLLLTPILLSQVQTIGLDQILKLKLPDSLRHGCPLFENMTTMQIKRSVLISETMKFLPGESIIRQGDVGQTMAVIIRGQVEVNINLGSRAEVLAHLGPGQVFGEVGFVAPIPRTANVIAVSDVEVLILNAGRLAHQMKFFPRITAKLNLNISRLIGGRLELMIDRERQRDRKKREKKEAKRLKRAKRKEREREAQQQERGYK
ncbi:MAG: cyclic nucleotide-binding domain-containing protein, partial [Magnetococcales bacterium]|nr:cyclic nucleotide-binding domain-containing protein [Magnetococcales bacterium]